MAFVNVSAVLFVIFLSAGEVILQRNQRVSSTTDRIIAGGRPFEVVQTNDGRRILVFLEDGGGRRRVQTISSQSPNIVESFPPDPSYLSRRQRRGLEKLRRDLTRLLRRRTNLSRYTITSGRNRVPEVARRRNSRQRALSRNDVIHMIQVITQYLSGELVTSQTQRTSSLLTSRVTSPLTSTFSTSSATFNPTTSTLKTTLRPVSITSSSRPTAHASNSERLVTQLREEEQKLIALLQTTTLPTTNLTTENGIVNTLQDRDRRLIQELAGLERTTLLPTTPPVTRVLSSREFLLNRTRSDILQVKKDLQRIQGTLLHRLRNRHTRNNAPNAQSNAEFVRLQNIERNLLHRLRSLQSKANQITRDQTQPVATEKRDEIMRSNEKLMNVKPTVTNSHSGGPQPVGTVHSRLDSVLLSLENGLGKDEQLVLIRVLGETERGGQVKHSADINHLMRKLQTLLTGDDFIFIRDVILGKDTGTVGHPTAQGSLSTQTGPQENTGTVGHPTAQGSISAQTGPQENIPGGFPTSDIDKIAKIVQSHLHPEEQEAVMNLLSQNHQQGSHLLHTQYARLGLEKLKKVLTFSEYNTLERLIHGAIEQPQESGNAVNGEYIARLQSINQHVAQNHHLSEPTNQHVAQNHHSSDPTNQHVAQNHHLSGPTNQHVAQNPIPHRQGSNIVNDLIPPSTSEFIGHPALIQQNQIQPQNVASMVGQMGVHPVRNVPVAPHGFHGMMGLPMPAFMQELMFGDTTDPPDLPNPSTTPSTKAPTTVTKAPPLGGVVDQSSPSLGGNGGNVIHIPSTTPYPNTNSPSMGISSHIQTIMHVLKSSGMPKNVKLEFHLPKQSQNGKEPPKVVESKPEKMTTPVHTSQVVKQEVTFPYKVDHFQKNHSDVKKDHIIVNNQQSQVFVPFGKPQSDAYVRVQVHETQANNKKPVFGGSHVSSNRNVNHFHNKYQVINHSGKKDNVDNLSKMKTSNYIRETPIVYQEQLPRQNIHSQKENFQANPFRQTTKSVNDAADHKRSPPRRKPPTPKSIEELEQINKLHFQIPLYRMSQGLHNPMTPQNNQQGPVLDSHRRILPTLPPTKPKFTIQNKQGSNLQNRPHFQSQTPKIIPQSTSLSISPRETLINNEIIGKSIHASQGQSVSSVPPNDQRENQHLPLNNALFRGTPSSAIPKGFVHDNSKFISNQNHLNQMSTNLEHDTSISQIQRGPISAQPVSDMSISQIQRGPISARPVSDTSISQIQRGPISAQPVSDTSISQIQRGPISPQLGRDASISQIHRGPISPKLARDASVSQIQRGPISPQLYKQANTDQSNTEFTSASSTKGRVNIPFSLNGMFTANKPAFSSALESNQNINTNRISEMRPPNQSKAIQMTGSVSAQHSGGIPVTIPPKQTSFSAPQYLHKTNDHSRKWEEVKKLEKAADNQIKNIILNTGGNVQTSFWDSLVQKNVSSAGHVIKINLDSNLQHSPLLKEKKVSERSPTTEEVEAEDITTTTTAKPSEEFRMEIHTNQDGVSKISIIPQSNQSENKSKCDPSSVDFTCVGKAPFNVVKSIGTWCLAKCLQGSCVETVCSCSCDRKFRSPLNHSKGEDVASVLSRGGNSKSTNVQTTLNEIYTSLRENSNAQSQKNIVQNGEHVTLQNDRTQIQNNGQNSGLKNSMDVQFLLRSIEGMIEDKLRRMTPVTSSSPPAEEEVEAEDMTTVSPSNNWNNNGNNNNGNNNNWNNNNNGNNNNGKNNNWNNNGNNNNWNNNNNGNNNGNNNNGNNNNGNNNNWNNNGNNNWNNNGNNNNGNNWNNNNGNNDGNNWNNNNNNWNNNNGNYWGNNGPWQNGNWNNGPNNSPWNSPPPNWNQAGWNNRGPWGGPNSQWNNWGGHGNWNMAFSRRNQWQGRAGGGGGEAAD